MSLANPESQSINVQHALIYVMVTMTAVDASVGDAELGRIGRFVQTLPVFDGFDIDRLTHVTQECAEILQVDEGLDTVLALVQQSLPEHLHETAYALGVEIAIADRQIAPEEVRFLNRLRDTLKLDKLACAAIERAAVARYQKL